MACRQLGFSGGEVAAWEGIKHGTVTNVRCSGNETSLVECELDFNARVPESYAVGVECSSSEGGC